LANSKAKQTRTALRERNTKVQQGIDKDLANLASIQLAGEMFTPASLKAVFQDDTAAMDATDAARKTASQAVLDEKAKRTRAALILGSLREYLLGTYGKQAVAILGDFGITAPKAKAKKTVASKAVAVAKAKATRVARGTKGPVARQDTVGTVNATAIEEAINSPTESPIAKAGPAAPPAAAAPAAAPAASASAAAAPKAGA